MTANGYLAIAVLAALSAALAGGLARLPERKADPRASCVNQLENRRASLEANCIPMRFERRFTFQPMRENDSGVLTCVNKTSR